MNTQIDDGGPAFPLNPSAQNRGMSLRDWFAGMAISGMMHDGFVPDFLDRHAWDYAHYAYDMADMMLKRREATAAASDTTQHS